MIDGSTEHRSEAVKAVGLGVGLILSGWLSLTSSRNNVGKPRTNASPVRGHFLLVLGAITAILLYSLSSFPNNPVAAFQARSFRFASDVSDPAFATEGSLL